MKYYAIRKGKVDNTIVRSWDECSRLVTGYSGAVFKSFTSEQAAKSFLDGPSPKWEKPVKKKRKPLVREKKLNGKCLLRKSYNDPFTGEYFKNRCVIRKFKTTTGRYFVETGDNSVPFDED